MNINNIDILRDLSYKDDIYMSLSHMRKHQNLSLLSFRKIDKFLYQDLIHNTISLSNPQLFNDPFDCPIYKWLPKVKKALLDKGNKEIDIESWEDAYKKIKVACFSKEFDNITKKPSVENHLMWAHYADKHYGVCLQYEFNEDSFNDDEENLIISRFADVRYETSMSLDQLEELSYSQAFLVKFKYWEYENECRLIHYDGNDCANYKKLNIPSGTLKAIYFGLRCSSSDINAITKTLYNQNIKGVRFYRMSENTKNIYRLSYREYV